MGDPRITFIGAGNMASAIIAGIVRAGTYAPEAVTATDLRQEALDALSSSLGIRTTQDNAEAVRDADVVVLAVKPQILPGLLPELAPLIGQRALCVSVAAGVALETLQAMLGDGARVVRAMPNTPAFVGAGATGLAAGEHATEADVATVERIFAAVGITERVDEAQLDVVTALSGSGPAYVFRMVEALVSGAVAQGLAADQALRLATQTVYGAAKLLSESDDGPDVLRQRVTSPGGTTAAGLQALEDYGYENVIERCIAAAAARGRELGEEARKPKP